MQIRPAGPSLDPLRRALRMIRDLSHEDFGSPGIAFLDDGTIQPMPRERVRALPDTY